MHISLHYLVGYKYYGVKVKGKRLKVLTWKKNILIKGQGEVIFSIIS